MPINWDWFKKYFKSIAIIFGVIIIISKIDIWFNGTEKSFFLEAISPFIKSIIGDALIVLLILLIVIFYNEQN